MTKHLEIILKKMCSYVNADYDKIDFKNPEWFMKHEWTAEQEGDFRKWMVKYLMQHPAAQKELYGYIVNKRINEERVSWFRFDYGWKTK